MMCGLTADNNLLDGPEIHQTMPSFDIQQHTLHCFYINETTLFCEGVGGRHFLCGIHYILLAAIWQILASSDEYYYRVMQHGIMTLTADFIFRVGRGIILLVGCEIHFTATRLRDDWFRAAHRPRVL